MEKQICFYVLLMYLVLSGGVGLGLLFNCKEKSKTLRKIYIPLGCLLIVLMAFLGYGVFKSKIIDWFDVFFLTITIFYIVRCISAKSGLEKFRHLLTAVIAFVFVIFNSQAILSSFALLVFTDVYVALFACNNQKMKGNSILAIGAIFLYLFYYEYLPQKMKSWNGLMQNR